MHAVEVREVQGNSRHPVAVTELGRLAAALARHTGQEEAEALRHLFGRLSILIMRGNSALFTNRIPDYPQPEIDGVE